MEIVIATNNAHKVQEYEKMFEGINVKLYSLSDLNIHCDPEETGMTFEDNSKIKALEIARFTSLPIIADDSGLIVEALPSILGINTARFLGYETPYSEKMKEVIKRLENKANRSAKFVCAITLVNLDENIYQFVGEIKGQISTKIDGENGFGYDPIFIPDGKNVSFSRMSEDEKNAISHRGKATQKLKEFLMERIGV